MVFVPDVFRAAMPVLQMLPRPIWRRLREWTATSITASSTTAKPGLALFDFDGTRTRRDTVLPFLLSICGNPALPRFSVATARGFVGDADARHAAKATIIMTALSGRAAADVDAAGRVCTLLHVPAGVAPRGPGAARMASRPHGHRLAIVSASLEPYLTVVAELIGVELCLCTQLEVGDDGLLTGAMAGANCRRGQKVRRVHAVIEPDDYEVWAYGDTAGDEALLAMADHPVWVGRGARQDPSRRHGGPSTPAAHVDRMGQRRMARRRQPHGRGEAGARGIDRRALAAVGATLGAIDKSATLAPQFMVETILDGARSRFGRDLVIRHGETARCACTSTTSGSTSPRCHSRSASSARSTSTPRQ